MALDDLQGVIEKLGKMIEAHRRYLAENETRTRQVLIDPLLRELGWDVSDPDTVELEYWVRQKRADYALMSNGKPLAVVEAKKLGSDLGDDQIIQALAYAVAGGIPYIIVTDGDRWEMYEVFKQTELEEKLLMKLELSPQPARKNAEQVLAMRKPNLTAKEPVFKRPKRVSKRNKSPKPSKPPGRKSYSFDPDKCYPQHTKPSRLKIGNYVNVKVNAWQDVTQEVVVWLFDEGKLSGNNCPIETGKWPLINSEAVNRDGTRFINPQPLPNGLFLERGRGTPREQWEILWKLSEQFNIDLSEIEVFYKFIGKASR